MGAAGAARRAKNKPLGAGSGYRSRFKSRICAGTALRQPYVWARLITSVSPLNNSGDDVYGVRPFAKPGLAHRFAHQRANPGRIATPLTLTRFTCRQNSGSTTGRPTTPGCLTAFAGMNANPSPAATIAKVQSSRSLQ